MHKVILLAGLIILAKTLTPEASASDKETACTLQGDIIAAVQNARLERVRKASAAQTVLAANSDWPDGVATALPQVVDYVYSLRMRDIRNTDLGEATRVACIENFDTIQEITNSN